MINEAAFQRFSYHRPYPAYKDSGIEWLGEVPEHWEVKRTKTLLSRNNGGIWGMDFDDEGVVVLRSTEQTVDGEWDIRDPAKRRLTPSEYAACRLIDGDLVVTKSSGSALHIGKTSIVTRDIEALNCCHSNFMQRLRVKKNVAPRYMWYVLNGELGRTQFGYYSDTTTGLANLNAEIIGMVHLAVAPLPEQHTIAAFLDRETAKIDALIAKIRKAIDLLKEQRTALITQAVTKGFNPDVPMKDSGIEWLGEVPEHWEVKRTKTLLSRNNGGIWGMDFDDEGVVVLRSTEQTVDGEWDIRDPAKRRLTPSEYAACRLIDGDLVVTKSSGSALHIGKTSIVTRDIEALNCCHSNFMQRLRVKKNVAPRYMWYVLNGELGRTQFGYYSDTTTGLANLNAEIIGMVHLAVAPLPEQHTIAAFLDRETAKIDALIAKIRKAIDLLKEQRTALISAAVTGKIDVREAMA